jgi:hypothetical protein
VRTLTFTRTGDVDVASLRNPATQPPRVVSPAEALHGRYRETKTSTVGPQDYDYAVTTNCLRTGDRCMSLFHNSDSYLPLVFGSGKWSVDREFDTPCPTGGTAHQRQTGQYPLPEPPQDPVTLLTGRSHNEVVGSCTSSIDSDDKFARTGD